MSVPSNLSMKNRIRTLFVGSALAAAALLFAWLVHDSLTGAALPTWQDAPPAIQEQMAVHAPLSQALFLSALLCGVMALGAGCVLLLRALRKRP